MSQRATLSSSGILDITKSDIEMLIPQKSEVTVHDQSESDEMANEPVKSELLPSFMLLFTSVESTGNGVAGDTHLADTPIISS